MARKYKSLADYMEQTGTTQQALADKLGVTRSYICYLAAGQREPTLTLALRISKLTGVPVESLTRGEAVA